MSEPRVIKKYPNRRLYDTFESRYITLAQIKQLVVNNTDFVVVDKKSGMDITRGILLQVIAEEEQHDPALMSQEFLTHLIRTYRGSWHAKLGGHLDQIIRAFAAEHPR